MMCRVVLGFHHAPHAVWRAVVATIVVMVGATSAHAWAGGSLPPWSSLVVLAGVLFAASVLFLRGMLSWWVSLALVGAAQFVVHALSVALSAPRLGSPRSGTAAHDGMSGHAEMGAWSGRMLVAHAAVTVLSAAVWRLLARTAVAVVGWLAWPGGYREVRLAQESINTCTRALPALACLVVSPRRGPPTALRCR
jgi:hypothetical protein